MFRPIFTSFLLFSTALTAAEAPPALASLTYSGDQSALAALDRDLVAAATDPVKLAALETSLLAFLRRSDATFAARQAVCQRLGTVLAVSAPQPTAAALKVLGTMLLDERDSDLARLVLDPAPGAAIDALFTAAVGKTSGRTRLAIIDTIARRRIESAVPRLTTLLADKEAATAAAAARALGEIGHATADAALVAATNLEPAVIGHARLQASTRLPVADASRVLHELQDDANLPAALRAAAFRRSLELEPETFMTRVAQVLGGTDWAYKQVALEALAGALTPDRIRSLAAKLARWDAPTQTAVLAALARGGDASAVPAVIVATQHTAAEVRAEALAALGCLPGNRAVVALLARTASAGDSADAKTARQSLARLNGPDVSTTILAGAERGDAGIRPVYLEQLALRNMTEALPFLLKSRNESDATIRAAAVGALGDIAPFSEQGAVLAWTIAATDETEQTRALRALVNITLRNRSADERGLALFSAIESASPEIALRLMPALARLGGSASADCAARLAIRGDAAIANAAAAALSRWSDATALPALATLAEKASLPAVKNSARESAIRFLDRNRDKWTPATTTIVSRLLAATTSAVPRRQLVALLARADEQPALTLAEKLQSDATLGEDARYAAAAIQAALLGTPKLRASLATGISNALDRKTSTRWSAPALGDEWVEIDFLQSRPLRRITLDQTGRAAEFPEQYEVQVTDDPKAPGPALLKGKGQSNKTVIDFPAGTKGRYVVIRNTAERKDTPWTICELYVD